MSDTSPSAVELDNKSEKITDEIISHLDPDHVGAKTYSRVERLVYEALVYPGDDPLDSHGEAEEGEGDE